MCASVVWDSASSQYALRTFARSSSACQALLAHVGRSFIVSATLQVRANYRLRCQSWFDIAWADLIVVTDYRTVNNERKKLTWRSRLKRKMRRCGS